MHYSGLILDLDGVVYIGPDAVAHAVESLNLAAGRGVRLFAATNNANRSASTVAEHLHALGLHIHAEDVVTSAWAAAQHLSVLLPASASVLAVGGVGVSDALESVGLVPLRASADLEATHDAMADAAAVLIGYGPLVAWFDLAAAHFAISRGIPWFATNTDATVPTKYGRAPGNGAMVNLLRGSTGTEPVVIGKPQPGLFEVCVIRHGSRDLLVVGDRLDTDVDGAVASGLDSLLVLTGVHGLADLAQQPLSRWPTYVAPDLRSLDLPIATPRCVERSVTVSTDDSFERDIVRFLNAVGAGETPDCEVAMGPASAVDLRGFVAQAGSVAS